MEGLDLRGYDWFKGSRCPIKGLTEDNVSLKDVAESERLKIETSIAFFYIKHPDLRITQSDYDRIISNIVSSLDESSPYNPKNAYTEEDLLLLLERLSLISPHITDKKKKFAVDKFILLLTKFFKGEDPGDNSAKGMTISKTYFEGNNIAIISFLERMEWGVPNYRKCLIEGIQSVNPSTRIYIATQDQILGDDFVPATKDNVMRSITFIEDNICRFPNPHLSRSVAQRLIDAYVKAPENEDTHIILFLGYSGQPISGSGEKMQIPLYFKNKPKKIRLSIVITSEIDIDKLKQSEVDRNYDYGSLLKTAVYSGGDIYVNDVKKTIFDMPSVKKWFNELK